MLASLTGLGLSAAAGLNAYIPLLLVGLLSRFTSVITLPEPYRWIQSGWALGVMTLLLLAEVVLDKVAVVDHVNDLVQTLVRPTVGGVVFAATAAAEQADASAWMQRHQWLGFLLGVLVAGIVHASKAGQRLHRRRGHAGRQRRRGRRLPGHEPGGGVPAGAGGGRAAAGRLGGVRAGAPRPPPAPPQPCRAGLTAAAGRSLSPGARRGCCPPGP
jgi:hypothetical protein